MLGLLEGSSSAALSHFPLSYSVTYGGGSLWLGGSSLSICTAPVRRPMIPACSLYTFFGRVAARRPRQCVTASSPAFATTASCTPMPPLAPIPPMTLPSTRIGKPPSATAT